jgi:hypothetical protein
MSVSDRAKQRLIDYFAFNPAWVAAARPLADGVCSRLLFEGEDIVWSLVRRNGCSILEPGEPENPDLQFVFSEGAIDYLTELDEASIGDFAARLYECAFLLDDQRMAELTVISSMGQILKRGYWKIALKGGFQVLKIARAHGIGGPRDFQRIIGLLQGKNSADVRAAIRATRKDAAAPPAAPSDEPPPAASV